MDFQEMTHNWWINAVWLWMDAEHQALPMEGIEHLPNTSRAPKGTVKVNILIVKKHEILNEIFQASTVKF